MEISGRTNKNAMTAWSLSRTYNTLQHDTDKASP